MVDYLENGYQYIPAIVSPNNAFGIFFSAAGVMRIIKNPFSAAPVEVWTSGLSGGGLLTGAGVSGTPVVSATAGNFVQYYVQTTATSGDVRALYVRLYFAGVGASGEAARLFTTVSGVQVAVGGTVNGAHISLGLVGAGANISGQAFGLRVDFETDGNVTAIGGSQSAVALFETNIPAGPTLPADLAFLRFNNLAAQKLANFINITNPDTTAMFVNAGTGAGSAGNSGGSVCAKVLKILVGGTAYWIGLNSTNS